MKRGRRGDKRLARISRTQNGRQKLHSKAFDTKAQAKEWKPKNGGRCDAGGGWVVPTRLTLNSYLDGWLAGPMEARQRDAGGTTPASRSYVRPTLGDYRLQQLDTEMVRVH